MKFDAIVIGAGPSGSASAYAMAKAGYKVLLVEKGPEPGSKNVSGAMIRNSVISQVFETKDLPFERIVKKVRLIFKTRDNEVEITVKPKDTLYTVTRLKLDKWMAQKAESAGAILITKTTVNGIEGNKVITERGDVEADKIVIAEGANALLSTSLGLRRELKSDETVLGVKEVYASTRDEVSKRFMLQGDDGESWRIITDYPISSAGFIYTYKDSVAIGIGAKVDEIAERGLRPFEVLDIFKEPYSELIKGFSLREYSAKIIPENGFPSFNPCEGKIFVVGDALGLIDPLTFDGIGPAVLSGYLAGKAEECSSYTNSLYQTQEIMKVVKSRPLTRELLKGENMSFYVNLINDFMTSWAEGDFSKLKYYKSSIGKILKHLILGLGVIE